MIRDTLNQNTRAFKWFKTAEDKETPALKDIDDKISDVADDGQETPQVMKNDLFDT